MRTTLPIAALVGIAAAATLLALVTTRGANEAPAPTDLLAILSSEERPEDRLPDGQHPLPTETTEVTRYLGEIDNRRYFVTARDDKICLLASDATTTTAGCRSPEAFQSSAQTLSAKTAAGPAFTAFLLPDGYADSAETLPWATLVGENLLVVTDPATAPERERPSLAPDDPDADPLELVILQ